MGAIVITKFTLWKALRHKEACELHGQGHIPTPGLTRSPQKTGFMYVRLDVNNTGKQTNIRICHHLLNYWQKLCFKG
jgi:hypothetical protein